MTPPRGVEDAAPYILGRELSANRRGGIHPSRPPSATANFPGGLWAGRPTCPFRGSFCRERPCPFAGRRGRRPLQRGNPQVFSPSPISAAACGQAAPHPTLSQASRHIPLLFTHNTKQKAGANISFAPAVLLLRSHSLITLFVIFRTASASSWESSYRLRILIALSGSY